MGRIDAEGDFSVNSQCFIYTRYEKEKSCLTRFDNIREAIESIVSLGVWNEEGRFIEYVDKSRLPSSG